MKLSKTLRTLALLVAIGAPLGAIVTSAEAAPTNAAAPAKDKNPRVTVDATFERYLLDAHGHVHGLLLKDGSVVHAPEATVHDTSMKAGDALKIEAHAKSVAGVTLYGRALVKKNGAVVVDATQKVEHTKQTGGKLADFTSSSTITYFLYDRKGEIRGLVLADGTVAHAGKGAKLDDYKLKKGDAVTITGKGGSYALGRAMRIETIKLPSGDVKKP
jgi:hypothetical protein